MIQVVMWDPSNVLHLLHISTSPCSKKRIPHGGLSKLYFKRSVASSTHSMFLFLSFPLHSWTFSFSFFSFRRPKHPFQQVKPRMSWDHQQKKEKNKAVEKAPQMHYQKYFSTILLPTYLVLYCPFKYICALSSFEINLHLSKGRNFTTDGQHRSPCWFSSQGRQPNEAADHFFTPQFSTIAIINGSIIPFILAVSP